MIVPTISYVYCIYIFNYEKYFNRITKSKICTIRKRGKTRSAIELLKMADQNVTNSCFVLFSLDEQSQCQL